MAKTEKAEKKSIAELIKLASKNHNVQVGTLDEITKDIVGLPTGNLAIDHILGVGGLPTGRVVEMYGKPGSGKTTTALQCAAALQKKIIAQNLDEYILYVDFEHALDGKYVKNLGLDMNHPSVLLAQPDTLEEGAQMVRDFVASGKVKLLIWDSVAEATPDAIKMKDTGEATVAVRAKIMSQFLQQVNSDLYRNDCTAIFINHVMVKINTTGYSRVETKTTPGGDALKFYCSVRLEFNQIKSTKGKRFDPLTNELKDFTVSADVDVRVVKNKVGHPQKNCTVRVRYGKGFDNFWSALQVLVGHKVIPNSAGYYYFEKLPHLVHEDMETTGTGRKAVRGEDAILSFADSHVEWRDKVIAEAVSVIASAEGTEDVVYAINEDAILNGFDILEEE
jgi:recombination protein RecA